MVLTTNKNTLSVGSDVDSMYPLQCDEKGIFPQRHNHSHHRKTEENLMP